MQTHGFRKLIKAQGGNKGAAGSGAVAIRNSRGDSSSSAFCLVVRGSIEDMLDEAKGMINAISGQ